jgi:hypothetical protein
MSVDAYVRRELLALEVFHSNGHSLFHGINGRTLNAFARRGLVWFDHERRGGLTDEGRRVLAELTAPTTGGAHSAKPCESTN